MPRSLLSPLEPPQPPMLVEAATAYENTVLAWADPLPDEVIALRNQSYGADPRQRFDVFTRPGLQDAPVLVFWHGGGWTNGYKEYAWFMAPLITRLGIVLITPTYRLAPTHKLPAANHDAMQLLDALPPHLWSWGASPEKIFVAGHSAGGSIAAMTALQWPRRAASRQASPLTLRGCLPISGIMNLYHPSPAPGSLEENVYRTLLRTPDEDAAMSPLSWTGGNTVPMLISHGEHDSERVIRSNRSFHHLLLAQGAPVTHYRFDGADHFETHTRLAEPDHPWYGQLTQFIKAVLQ